MVAIAREIEVLERARRVLGRCVKNFDLPASTHDPMAGEEIAKIEQAILKGNVPVIEEYGGLQATFKRSIALKKVAH